MSKIERFRLARFQHPVFREDCTGLVPDAGGEWVRASALKTAALHAFHLGTRQPPMRAHEWKTAEGGAILRGLIGLESNWDEETAEVICDALISEMTRPDMILP